MFYFKSKGYALLIYAGGICLAIVKAFLQSTFRSDEVVHSFDR